MPGGAPAEAATEGRIETTRAAATIATTTARWRPETSGNGAPSWRNGAVSTPTRGCGPEGDAYDTGPVHTATKPGLIGRLSQPTQEGRRPLERVVEDRLEGVTESRIRDQLGIRQERDAGTEQLDIGHRIRFPGQQQHRTGDPRPVRGPLVGHRPAARKMERVAVEHERRVVGACLGGGQTCDAAAVRLAADDRSLPALDAVADDSLQNRDRGLGLLEREVDRHRVDATSREALDMAGHTGRRTARAVSDEEPDAHRAQG